MNNLICERDGYSLMYTCSPDSPTLKFVIMRGDVEMDMSYSAANIVYLFIGHTDYVPKHPDFLHYVIYLLDLTASILARHIENLRPNA